MSKINFGIRRMLSLVCGQIPIGFASKLTSRFHWHIMIVENSTIICSSTPPSTLVRTPAPPPPPKCHPPPPVLTWPSFCTSWWPPCWRSYSAPRPTSSTGSTCCRCRSVDSVFFDFVLGTVLALYRATCLFQVEAGYSSSSSPLTGEARLAELGLMLDPEASLRLRKILDVNVDQVRMREKLRIFFCAFF